MGLTLYEASKISDGNVYRQGVIEMFARESEVLRVMPFMDITGGAYTYNVEHKLPGVTFRGYNEGYERDYGVINPETERLRIAGGDLDVDIAMIRTHGENIRTTQEAMRIKGMALEIGANFINGNSQSNPREFDGLRARIAGRQLLPANLANGGANGPLSLEALDKAIDEVDGANAIIMSKDLLRKVNVGARAGVGGEITYDLDEFGRRVTRYNGIQIVDPAYDKDGQKVLQFNEAGPGGQTNATSVYVVNLNDGYVTGLQNGGMDVRDLGELEALPVYRTRIEWLVGFAVMHGRAASRIWGITDAAVTA